MKDLGKCHLIVLSLPLLVVVKVIPEKVIPEKYILGRWTRDARCGIVQDFRGKEVEGDPKLARNRMFRQVVSKFIRTATEASYSKESLESLDNGVDVLFKKVMEDRGKAIKKVGDNNDHPTVVSS